MKKLKKKSIALISFIILTVIFLILFFYIQNKNKTTENSYALYKVKQQEDLVFSGKVQAADSQRVTYDQSLGNITEINVKDGDEVKAGDVLVTYSSESNQFDLVEKNKMQEQYNSNIANLQSDLSNQKEHVENIKNWITNIKEEIGKVNTWDESSDKSNRLSQLQTELSEAQQALQSAETQIGSIESSITTYKDQLAGVNASIATLENTRQKVITAGFDGIAKVNVKGQTNSSEPVVTVYSKEQVVKTSVTEYDIEKLTQEQLVKVSYVNQDKNVEGKIITIDAIPESDTENVGSYQVEISLVDDIPLGYSVQVKVSQPEVRIPNNVIVEEQNNDEKNYYVYKYEKGKAIKTEVTIERKENYSRILTGIKYGDKILVKPEGLKNNMDVKVL